MNANFDFSSIASEPVRRALTLFCATAKSLREISRTTGVAISTVYRQIGMQFGPGASGRREEISAQYRACAGDGIRIIDAPALAQPPKPKALPVPAAPAAKRPAQGAELSFDWHGIRVEVNPGGDPKIICAVLAAIREVSPWEGK